ncbi:TIGR00730 family Rossman fold protein [Candidatus Woesearchaeota archaeon]|nr:TIGR00730 family Rossman fold protein [Candidatus Woesearchaeota archaeon]HIH25782.1 TIGR00730 family Rossman fold protein [Nanoarchaeota archaeon]
MPLNKNKEYYQKTEWTLDTVQDEINNGLQLLNSIQNPIVSFFGSHRVKPGTKYYEHCKKLSNELGKNGYAIISGGGPGIMHAANSGAKNSGTDSIGLMAKLLTDELIKEKIFTHKLEFHFLFVRRFIMSIKSEALVFYPGGYGTLNELFEYAVLMQTGIVDKVPIICVNKKYWKGLFNWLEKNPEKENMFIHNNDIRLLYLVDEIDEVINIIKN